MDWLLKLSVEYEVTLTTGAHIYDDTDDILRVKLIGTAGETDVMWCYADLTEPDVTASCTLTSSVDIGHYRCVQLRNVGDDGASIVEVIL